MLQFFRENVSFYVRSLRNAYNRCHAGLINPNEYIDSNLLNKLRIYEYNRIYDIALEQKLKVSQ